MGIKGFAEGGIAAVVAGSATHPLDLIKVRMQLQGESPPSVPSVRPALAFSESAATVPRRIGPIAIGVKIFRTEGPAALFSGVSATILRQALYSTTRIGLYDVLKSNWSAGGDPKSPNLPLHKKIIAGLIAGAVGAAVGNPADVAMVRMQADGRLPATERRNYSGVGNAIAQMARREGVLSLWRGSGLTVNRAMIVTASQLATYDQAKEAIVGNELMRDGMPTHVAASFAAGLVASAASNPVDVVKTRVMNMKVEKGVPPPYTGAVDCVMKTVKTEGLTALYKGFVPTVTRQGPFTVVLFVTLEQVRSLLKDF